MAHGYGKVLTGRRRQEGRFKVSSASSVPGAILDVVTGLLQKKGYDGWQLRDVADGAHVSFTTIYKSFPSREALIVAAVERWMAEHVYRPIPVPAEGVSVFDALVDALHHIFEPWEEHPEMLQVFVQACSTSGRERLRAQGNEAIAPVFALAEAQLDPAFAADLNLVLSNVVEGALTRYVNHELRVTEILPILVRTLHRLEQASTAASTPPPRKRPTRSPTSGQSHRSRGAKPVSKHSSHISRYPRAGPGTNDLSTEE